MKTRKLAIINFVSLLLVFFFNFLTGRGYINDLSQKTVSDMYPTKITPSGFAFSIWGVIYLLVGIVIVLMLIRNREKEYHEPIQAMSYWFLVSSLANILWTVAFSYLQILLSTVLIFILLFSLIMIIKQLSKLKKPINFFFALAFGMYAGWVLIASVLNVAVTLTQFKFSGFGLNETAWANLILIISIIIVLLVTLNTKNIVIPLPVAWAYYAIYSKEGLIVALMGIVFLLGISFYQLKRNRFKLQV